MTPIETLDTSYPKLVYYNDNPPESHQCTSKISSELEIYWSTPGTWSQLVTEIADGNEYIAFNASMIAKSMHTTAVGFIDAIKIITRFLPNCKELKVGVVITPSTPATVIRDFQKAGAQGILLDIDYYSIEEVKTAINALMNNIPYWPKHIISQLPDPRHSLPTVISFWSHPCMPPDNDIKQQVLDKNLYRVNFCDSWDTLADCADDSADLILFHASMVGNQGLSASKIVNMISTLVHYTGGQDPKIGAVIDKNTPVNIVNELRKTNICGIVPNSTHWGVDVGTSSVVALLNNKSYWPEHIIDKLPNPPLKPLQVYIRSDWKEFYTQHFIDEFNKLAPVDTQAFTGWDEVMSALTCKPNQLLFHIDMFTDREATIPELVEMLKTRLKLSNLDVPIGVDIESDTPVSVIKELKRAGIFGIIPSGNSFGKIEAMDAVVALTNRIPYWPKHIIDRLPGAEKKPTTGEIKLTSRQEQVFRLIKERGASNKVIAKSLGIGESTVKLHIGVIFRKYGVKNRTQLAVFAK